MQSEPRSEPQPVIKQFRDTEEIDRGIAKVRRRIEDVKGLAPSTHRFDGQEKKNVQDSISKTILAVFGNRSPEYIANKHFSIRRGPKRWKASVDERQRGFAEGIPEAITMLEGLIRHLEEEKADFNSPQPVSQSQEAAPRDAGSTGETESNLANLPNVTIHGNGTTVALANSIQNVTVVTYLGELAKQVEDSAIPAEDRKKLLDHIQQLLSNPWIQQLGTGGIIAAGAQAIAGG